jgi:hypothetical protein
MEKNNTSFNATKASPISMCIQYFLVSRGVNIMGLLFWDTTIQRCDGIRIMLEKGKEFERVGRKGIHNYF